MIQWKPIPGFEDRYEVSNTGQVRSLRHGRGPRDTPLVLATRPDGGGYPQVRLYRNDGGHSYPKVHRLVASLFLDTPPDETVNHIDRDKTNNHVSNLEWMSNADNQRHAWATSVPRRDSEGCLRASRKNQRTAVAATKRFYSVVSPEGKRYSFWGLNEFCREHGLGASKMSRVCRGLDHQHKGWTNGDC